MPLNPDPKHAYFIRLRGKVFGPFNTDRLRSMQSRGQFSRLHEISADRVNWESAGPFMDAMVNPVPPIEPVDVAPMGLAPAPTGPPRAAQAASWYYSVGSEEHGPVSMIDLRSLRMSGRLHGTDLVWREGMADWQPVSATPELQMEGQSGGSNRAETSGDGVYRTSGFAVTSMVMGILGILTPLLIFNLLAVVFGGIAMKTISKSTVKLGGRGLAVTGIVLGSVGLAVWAMVIVWWVGLFSAAAAVSTL